MDESERQRSSAANAVGGSTARACDGCLRRRARWYCGADDAFLCQVCDSSVHSANSLARRHQRLRLHTASSSSPPSSSPSFLIHDPTYTRRHPVPISWRRRKPRTPRPYHLQSIKLPPTPAPPEPLVPDLDVEDEEELEMQIICRVPVLDPFFANFCPPLEEIPPPPPPPELTEMDMLDYYGLENLDVESLLGVGLDDVMESSLYHVEGFAAAEGDDVGRIKMELDLDGMGDCLASLTAAAEDQSAGEGGGVLKKMGLRLNYDAVIDAWSRSSGNSPWATGGRPQFDTEGAGCLPAATFTGMSSEGANIWGRGRWAASGGEEREARVTRYREKRRTRLFAKKIRYEVRKLNAEKRPRMKGRFVKRTAVSTAA
ncbi:Zinc finger protein CONSTANS-LIKE 16 [Platanthera zijinensis]|uniref:Zinc finger protein CONSTANS-LIKE 16 n=1 Tax=Platanthera zijinensis TaxID=2320716 RepID=A0AAP0FX59_9ASPA